MMINNVLILEDDERLGLSIVHFLKEKGIDATLCLNIDEGKKAILHIEFDLWLCDLYLNICNNTSFERPHSLPAGIHFVAEAKKKATTLPPFIFFSSENDPKTKEYCFELGAIDYLSKPFSLKELDFRLDRLKGLFKTPKISLTTTPDLILEKKTTCIGTISFKGHYLKGITKTKKEEIIVLANKEILILFFLMGRVNEVVSRDEIVDFAWGINAFPSHRTIDNYIVSLRKYFEAFSWNFGHIKSVRGVGYEFFCENPSLLAYLKGNYT